MIANQGFITGCSMLAQIADKQFLTSITAAFPAVKHMTLHTRHSRAVPRATCDKSQRLHQQRDDKYTPILSGQTCLLPFPHIRNTQSQMLRLTRLNTSALPHRTEQRTHIAHRLLITTISLLPRLQAGNPSTDTACMLDLQTSTYSPV